MPQNIQSLPLRAKLRVARMNSALGDTIRSDEGAITHVKDSDTETWYDSSVGEFYTVEVHRAWDFQAGSLLAFDAVYIDSRSGRRLA